jgi:hypothetical protein
MPPAAETCALHAAIIVVAALLAAALTACGTVDRIRGQSAGAAAGPEAPNVSPEDPTARAVQIAWTSARASYCGFIFDPNQLRANYLAFEARAGKTPSEIAKLEHAYNYAHESVTDKIKDDVNYCNKDRTATIRRDLNRYLAGDYTTRTTP